MFEVTFSDGTSSEVFDADRYTHYDDTIYFYKDGDLVASVNSREYRCVRRVEQAGSFAINVTNYFSGPR